MRVLALTRKPDSPSFEQRVLNHIDPLDRRGVAVQWRYLPKDGREKRQVIRMLGDFDLVWWHRYLIPPFSSGRWRRAARCIVFDFDDPITYSTHGSGRRANLSRSIKFAAFLKRCDAALAGSEYLAGLARRYCPRVLVQPMAVELPDTLPERRSPAGAVELLWVGSRSTTRFLESLLPVLDRVGELRPSVRLRVVGHREIPPCRMEVDFRPWSRDEQDRALAECDVGLCPMPDTPWARGKCPYKVLQYMAWGMPWVGSVVGESVVAAGGDGADKPRGLCAADSDGWVSALLDLIDNVDLRSRLGRAGRIYVEKNHSRDGLSDRLAAALRDIAAAAGNLRVRD